MNYSVSEIAKKMNVSAATIRYYDQEGLLPHVARTAGGARVFTEADFRWLNLISCLKKAGMPLKDIRRYIEMTVQGEETLEERLQMFQEQKRRVQKQIEELQQTLNVVNYKCWYYETALQVGDESDVRDMPPEELPEDLRSVREWLRGSGR